MALTGEQQETHRPGQFNKKNKQHKQSHRSKRSLDRTQKGRVSVKALSKKNRRELQRQERRSKANQLRKNKKDEIIFKKRSLGCGAAPPFLVAVISLHQCAAVQSVVDLIIGCDDGISHTVNTHGHHHISVPRFKQRFTIMSVCRDSLHSVLDVCKVADTVIFLLSTDPSQPGVDDWGEQLLYTVMGQGMPTTLFLAQGQQDLHIKKRCEMKKHLSVVVEKYLPGAKFIYSDGKQQDGVMLTRQIGEQKQNSIGYRDRRAHLLADTHQFIPTPGESSSGTLVVSGYVRGQPLNVNRLVHVPGWGNFQLSHIEVLADPYTTRRQRDAGAMEDIDVGEIIKPDPELQETLVSENSPDPLDAEQTWPTEEELQEAEEEQQEQEETKGRRKKRVPKGMSDYQAAWILTDSEESEGGDSDGDGDSDDDMMREAAEEVMSQDGDEEMMSGDDEEEYEEKEEEAEEDYDDLINMEEEREQHVRFKEMREDEQFPDEIDTPMDIPARERFAKYRGLQSFRTSPWDPKENLPLDYSRIFQFKNFNQTRKRILNAEEEGVEVGRYVRVHVACVPTHAAADISKHLVVYSMLPHEQKMTVINLVLKRLNTGYSGVISSKDRLMFHVGYRRFAGCPIFSQHTNGNKHKYEKFFRPGSICVASLFAPILFPPCPVTVFRENTDGSQDLVATGSFLSSDPDRIVSKRAVLSGHPYKIHHRYATIRYMFFNKEDIDWFKPVEIRTKYGRRGHIKESLGTHGHMKVGFDGQLKSMDTVLMTLYKRVFPKWTYDPYVPDTKPADDHT